jgi:flagellar motor switch protein FliM
MPEVLEQSEIDALLTSVAEEDAGAPRAEPGAPTGLYNRDTESRAYDFKRPERVSKDQIRTLATIHESFARNFGATLSGVLRTIVDVRVVGVEQLTYNEFINSLPNPTCFVILRAPPLDGQMCLEFSPLIVFPVIDRLLGGGSGETFFPQRSLTTIEWRIINRLTEKALDHLTDLWRNLIDAKFEAVETESNPQLVHVVAPTEVVVFITFEIKMGRSAGTMSLCIPFNVIEPVMGRLARQSWIVYKPRGPSESQLKGLRRNLLKSTLNVAAHLGSTTIRLSELRSLREGDVLTLDKPVEGEILLQVEGRTKFAGRPGQLRGHRALCITRSAEADEPM